MSWNLLIYKPGATDQVNEPLGALDAVTAVLNGAFPELTGQSPTNASLPVDRGFTLELTVKADIVENIYTNGGYDHLKEFAAFCKRQGWRICDAQEGEDVDLDEPYKWYEERGG